MILNHGWYYIHAAPSRSVCLMDEATSALDVRTERALADAMEELMKGADGWNKMKGWWFFDQLFPKRWWNITDFFVFHPDLLGEMIQFDEHIFADGLTPPTRFFILELIHPISIHRFRSPQMAIASHSQVRWRKVRGHDQPTLVGVAIAIDPFQVVYIEKIWKMHKTSVFCSVFCWLF